MDSDPRPSLDALVGASLDPAAGHRVEHAGHGHLRVLQISEHLD